MVLVYEELTEPERAVWDAIEAGTLVELSLGPQPRRIPAEGVDWGEDRQVRAQLLVEPLTGTTDPRMPAPRR